MNDMVIQGDAPVAGFYKTKLVHGGPWVGVRIWRHTSTLSDRVVLVDASGMIYRAYFTVPPMVRSDGTHVNAVYGFVEMLMRLIHRFEDSLILVIHDHSRHTFRNEIYPAYKAQRKPIEDDLREQLPLMRDATRAFNLPCIEQEGFEADDLIATYARIARTAECPVVIVSSDKDLMQLVGETVTMFDPLTNTDIGSAEVVEKFGLPPDKIADMQALAGDTVDNVPGVLAIRA